MHVVIFRFPKCLMVRCYLVSTIKINQNKKTESIQSGYRLLLSHSFDHFYVWSMLHLTRSCASYTDISTSDKSLLMLSNHLHFGLPLLLFPGTQITITLLPTYTSSLPVQLQPTFQHFLGHFSHICCLSTLSFLIFSRLVTPLKTSSFPPHPTSSLVLYSLPTSRHRTS